MNYAPTPTPETINVTLEVNKLSASRLLLTTELLDELKVNVPDEIAPLVSAENYSIDGVGYLRIRFIAFISDKYTEPEIGVTNNYATYFIQEGIKTKEDGTHYNAWYFHYDFPTGYLVNQITVFHTLEDPKTSRGTVTIVQSTLPPKLT